MVEYGYQNLNVNHTGHFMKLFYSLLLELQGDSTQAVEMYETALSKLENVKDITKIWTR